MNGRGKGQSPVCSWRHGDKFPSFLTCCTFSLDFRTPSEQGLHSLSRLQRQSSTSSRQKKKQKKKKKKHQLDFVFLLGNICMPVRPFAWIHTAPKRQRTAKTRGQIPVRFCQPQTPSITQHPVLLSSRQRSQETQIPFVPILSLLQSHEQFSTQLFFLLP